MTPGTIGPRRWLLTVAIVLGVLTGTPGQVLAGSRTTWTGDPYGGLPTQLLGVLADARERGIPGVSAAIETRGGVWTGVLGRASFHPDRAVTPDTAFEIGSVTKTFVTGVVLQLVEEGRLSLSARLSRWVSGIQYGDRITIRQLLSHTSGLRDLFDDPATQRMIEARPGHRWTFAEIARRIGPARSRPGAHYRYSNANFVLLGRIVERVTGMGIARAIRSRLLRPLGLRHTWFQGEEPTPTGMSTLRAMGYAKRGSGWNPYGNGTGLRPTTSMATFIWAAGAMMSTPTDLARWARALYGGRVVSPSSLALMTDFDRHDYGLGTRRALKGDREAWGHGGSLDGFITGMWYLPRLDASVVMMWNRWPWPSGKVSSRLAERLVDRLDPDTQPPTLTLPPRVGIATGMGVGTGPPTRASVPIAIAWTSATDDKGTIRRYELQQLVGSAWKRVPLRTPTARSVTVRVPAGSEVGFRVRAVDDEGNASPWREAPPVRVEVVDQTDGSVATTGAWSSVGSDGALGGSVLTSDATGAGISFAADGVQAVAVVTVRAPTRGRVGVAWDGTAARSLDLAGTPRQPRWIASAARWSDAGSHTVTVTLRTGAPERTDIDGFVMLRAVR